MTRATMDHTGLSPHEEVEEEEEEEETMPPPRVPVRKVRDKPETMPGWAEKIAKDVSDLRSEWGEKRKREEEESILESFKKSKWEEEAVERERERQEREKERQEREKEKEKSASSDANLGWVIAAAAGASMLTRPDMLASPAGTAIAAALAVAGYAFVQRRKE